MMMMMIIIIRRIRIRITTDHVTGGWKILAGMDYTDRHNVAAKNNSPTIGLITQPTPCYTYSPKTSLENAEYFIGTRPYLAISQT